MHDLFELELYSTSDAIEAQTTHTAVANEDVEYATLLVHHRGSAETPGTESV